MPDNYDPASSASQQPLLFFPYLNLNDLVFSQLTLSWLMIFCDWKYYGSHAQTFYPIAIHLPEDPAYVHLSQNFSEHRVATSKPDLQAYWFLAYFWLKLFYLRLETRCRMRNYHSIRPYRHKLQRTRLAATQTANEWLGSYSLRKWRHCLNWCLWRKCPAYRHFSRPAPWRSLGQVRFLHDSSLPCGKACRTCYKAVGSLQVQYLHRYHRLKLWVDIPRRRIRLKHGQSPFW